MQGAYGFPPQLAAEVAVRTLRSVITEVRLVVLVAFDRRTEKLFNRLLGSGEN